MAYRLPPPWDPGYALPSNVEDEGLQRAGYVTKQMPRGTYDQPRVGTGGYAVPQYVLDEGYGQGTFTTKWEPRGQYDGGKIPHWLNQRPRVIAEQRLGGGAQRVTFQRRIPGPGVPVPMQGLGGADLFNEYGQRAATAVLGRVARLPAAQRKPALKRIMDHVDPTLWNRTKVIGDQLMASGVPASRALHTALSQAMATGMTSEIVKLGQSRRAPKPTSLLGLGCYRGASALGATLTAAGLFVPAPVSCPGYTWVADAPGVPGHWERVKVGQVGSPGPGGHGCPVTEVHSAGEFVQSENGLVTGTSTLPAGSAGKQIQIQGLFTLPSDQDGTSISLDPRTLTTAQMQQIVNAAAISIGCWMTLQSAGGKVPGSQTVTMPSIGMRVPLELANSGFAVFRARHPVTGDRYALLLSDVGTAAAPRIKFTWTKVQTWLDSLVDGIVEVIAAIIDVVAAVVEDLGTLACGLLQQPQAGAAGLAAGGAPGAIGVTIAQQTACKPNPVVPMMPVAAESSLLPLAIVGGAGLLAVLMLSKKKKKAATP